MQKLDMQSKDRVQDNIQKIRTLFPSAVKEVKRGGKVSLAVDFDVLRQEMSSSLIEGNEERYQFTWPDKRKAILLANTPINATLRPAVEESENFDTTQNLYIEGDNLEVLKLLQETYLGRVKVIYIDPPYNTGKDFVYKDNFTQDAEQYKAGSGQYDEEGNRLVQNVESNGRFHTDWLNMIYPRLKIARDLLSDDGVIFISCDDNEQANLKKVCDEIFGATSYVNNFIWLNNLKGRQISDFGAVQTYENILCYAKNVDNIGVFSLLFSYLKQLMPDAYKSDEYDELKDELGTFVIKNELYNTNSAFNEVTRPNLVFNILYNDKTKDIKCQDVNDLTCPQGYTLFTPHINGDGVHSFHAWRWSRNKVLEESYDLYFDIKEKKIYTKIRTKTTNVKDIITNIGNGNKEVASLLGKNIFSYPKSTALLKLLISVMPQCHTVLDFFSGSATTAHAVMQLNAEDGGNRKFIMVQVPEKCDEKSEAYKAGYKNICEIGKERIRRAGKKIKEESPLTTQDLDTGFRVLKLDSSNMKDVYYSADEYKQVSLLDYADNIKEDRTSLDLLFQVMLQLGHSLSAKIEEKMIANKQVFVVDDDDIIACFAADVDEEVITEIAKMHPLYAVFRDSSMQSDSARVNFEQIFAAYSPATDRRVI